MAVARRTGRGNAADGDDCCQAGRPHRCAQAEEAHLPQLERLLDGRPLVELLAPGYAERAPLRAAAQEARGGEALVFDEQEEQQIAERLRGLGYLG